MDPLMNQYNESLSVDRVFYAQDIKGSIAYARANVKTGILTQDEFEKLEEGLKKILKEWEEDKFQPEPGDEGEQAPTHMLFSLPPCWSSSRRCSSGILICQTNKRGYQVRSMKPNSLPKGQLLTELSKRHPYCQRAPPR